MKNRHMIGVALLSVLMVGTLAPLTGCSTTASQVQADGQVLYNTIIQLAAVEEPMNPALAGNLTTAAQDLLAVTSVWQTGSAVATFNDAANAVEAALAAIPQTAAVAPFIPIIVGGIDLLIANIPGSTATPSASTSLTSLHVAANLNVYRIESQVLVHHRAFRSPEGDFRAAWNAVVKEHPVPGISAIK